MGWGWERGLMNFLKRLVGFPLFIVGLAIFLIGFGIAHLTMIGYMIGCVISLIGIYMVMWKSKNSWAEIGHALVGMPVFFWAMNPSGLALLWDGSEPMFSVIARIAFAFTGGLLSMEYFNNES